MSLFLIQRQRQVFFYALPTLFFLLIRQQLHVESRFAPFKMSYYTKFVFHSDWIFLNSATWSFCIFFLPPESAVMRNECSVSLATDVKPTAHSPGQRAPFCHCISWSKHRKIGTETSGSASHFLHDFFLSPFARGFFFIICCSFFGKASHVTLANL